MKRILYGWGRGREFGAGKPCRLRRDMMASAKVVSESCPNQILVVFRSSRHKTGSESMIARQDFDTLDARARSGKERKLRTSETSSGGRSVRKSLASVGVRTEWSVRKTESGECRRKVSSTCDWRGGGKLEKCESNAGRASSVVRDKSGWRGAWVWVCGCGDE